MGDETQDIAVADEEVLDAPEPRQRHGADGPRRLGRARAVRHSAAHVLAEAVLDLFPGTKLGSARSSRTASTTTSCCRAH